MCAIVAGPLRSAYSSSNAISVLLGWSVPRNCPLPLVETAGTSLAPTSLALKLVGPPDCPTRNCDASNVSVTTGNRYCHVLTVIRTPLGMEAIVVINDGSQATEVLV